MTPEKFLEQYRDRQEEARATQAAIEELRSMKMFPSVKLDGMPHNPNTTDGMSEWMARLDLLEAEMEVKLARAVEAYRRVVACIAQVHKGKMQNVLLRHYINGESYEEIAESWDMSSRTVARYKTRAMEQVKRIMHREGWDKE